MGSAPDLASSTGGESESVRQELQHDLAECEKRLCTMISRYKLDPKAIDNDLGASSEELNIEATVRQACLIVSSRVYSMNNPLQLNETLKEALEDQEDEFDDFYHDAIKALEAYREVLDNYRMTKGSAPPRPVRGDLEKIKNDVHTMTDERSACIKTIRNFHGKFSAMLIALQIPLKRE